MSGIYVPGGLANEYCGYSLNLYTGCNHQCLYCYTPSAVKRWKETYSTVTPTHATLRALSTQAREFSGLEVLLCFLTDPYNSLHQELKLTRKALEIFKDKGVIPVILTKAGLKSMRDFDLLADTGGKYGATLTFVNQSDSLAWEPGAAGVVINQDHPIF